MKSLLDTSTLQTSFIVHAKIVFGVVVVWLFEAYCDHLMLGYGVAFYPSYHHEILVQHDILIP